MTATPKADARFIIDVKDESSFGDAFLRFTANIAVMTGEGLRNPSFDSWRDEPGGHLADLSVRAQVSAGLDGGGFYGYRAEFTPFSVNLALATSMAKVLRSIDRKLEAAADRRGSPVDLADYMSRLAEAIGATESWCFARRTQASHELDGSGFRWMDTDALRHHLNDQIDQWRTRHHIVRSAA